MSPVVLAALLAGTAAHVVVRGPAARVRLGRLEERSSDPLSPPSVAAGVRSGTTAGRSRGNALGSAALRLVVSAGGLLRRSSAREREADRAAEACGALVGELHAGRSPELALAVAAEVAVGGVREALRAASAAARVGADPAGRLLDAAASSAGPELLRGLAACWSVCSATGAGLAAAVERLTEAERDARERRRALAAELAGPRATARLLAVLPLLGIALAAGLGASPVRFLLTPPYGTGCLALALVLDAVGLAWTRRLVRSAVRA